MKAVVSEKGQVTIPKQLRDRLGIEPGEVLEFTEDDGRLVAIKHRRLDPIDGIYGVLRGQPDTDALIEQLRASADLP